MTKVLKLNVSYSGYYGGDVDETMILPLDINGVFFEELEVGEYEDAIYLGEIEGKHSEVHGDLSVDIIDLDNLSLKEVSNLIEQSDSSQFDSYFEGAWDDIDEDEDEYDEQKVNAIREKYGVDTNSYETDAVQIHDIFIEQLKNKYVKSFRDVTVLEEDYDRVIEMLAAYNIKVFI